MEIRKIEIERPAYNPMHKRYISGIFFDTSNNERFSKELTDLVKFFGGNCHNIGLSNSIIFNIRTYEQIILLRKVIELEYEIKCDEI